MLGGAVALGVWPWFVLLWVTPLVTLLQAILRLRALFEHGAVSDTRDTRRAARTNLVSAPVQLLLFPFDMNYHIEHHLYPAVPHYRLAACHRAMVAHGLLDEAEVVRGIRPTLAKLFSEPRPRAA
jgi:fatty acid desaturase